MIVPDGSRGWRDPNRDARTAQTAAGRGAAPPVSLKPQRNFEQSITLGKLAVGYSHSLGKVFGFTPGVGASASLSLMPQELRPYYGSISAPGFAVIMSGFACAVAGPELSEPQGSSDANRRRPPRVRA